MKAEVTDGTTIVLASESVYEKSLIETIARGGWTCSWDNFILGEKSSSIMLVSMEPESKATSMPMPIIPQPPAVTVANFYNLLRKGNVPQELAEQLTRDYQTHLFDREREREIYFGNPSVPPELDFPGLNEVVRGR